MYLNRRHNPKPILSLSLAVWAAVIQAGLPVLATQKSEHSKHLLEANRLSAHKEYETAISIYQKAIQQTPEDPSCYHYFGRTLALSGKHKDALKQYKKALELKPRDAEIYNDIGVVLSLLGYPEDSARFIKRAVDIRPDYVTANNNLGAVLSTLKAFKQAGESFKHSLELQPHNSKIQDLLKEATSMETKSRDFSFGAPVGPESIPDVSGAQVKSTANTKVAGSLKNRKVVEGVSTKITDVPDEESVEKEAEQWLQEGQALFLPLSIAGFANVDTHGPGTIQLSDRCVSGDELKSIEPAKEHSVEVSGEVRLNVSGKGELSLGTFLVKAIDPECKFAIDCGQAMVTCYAGTFEIKNWPAVNALRAGKKVIADLEKCNRVYVQDDAKIKALECEDVSLVSRATGTIVECDTVLLNDEARALAIRCGNVTALGSSQAKVFDCGVVNQEDNGKIDFAQSGKY